MGSASAGIVEMYGHKNGIVLSIRDSHAIVQGNKSVVVPRHYDPETRRAELPLHPKGDIERHVFFDNARSARWNYPGYRAPFSSAATL